MVGHSLIVEADGHRMRHDYSVVNPRAWTVDAQSCAALRTRPRVSFTSSQARLTATSNARSARLPRLRLRALLGAWAVPHSCHNGWSNPVPAGRTRST